ncbi:MAG: hypothetical protein QOH57_2865 [Mycobacterium sp.]|nr:hypothetical protein [Mycobacterium sp.]
MSQRQRELRRVRDGGGPGADDAKIALGGGSTRHRLEAAIRALADHRGRDSSICPSDAARAVGGENWRDFMDDARELACKLARSGNVEITQRGKVIDPDGGVSGPIRIRPAAG